MTTLMYLLQNIQKFRNTVLRLTHIHWNASTCLPVWEPLLFSNKTWNRSISEWQRVCRTGEYPPGMRVWEEKGQGQG